MSNEIGYLAEEISKQSIEGVAWWFLTAYGKMYKEREKLKKELLSKKETELEDLENSQPIIYLSIYLSIYLYLYLPIIFKFCIQFLKVTLHL